MVRRRVSDLSRRTVFKRTQAKTLRVHATDAERIFWALLRGGRLAGLRFRRQQPIGPYIVDFFCPSAKLIIELDGGQHGRDEAVVYDEGRTRFLEARGYRVLRFWNHEVVANGDVAMEAIWRAVQPSS